MHDLINSIFISFNVMVVGCFFPLLFVTKQNELFFHILISVEVAHGNRNPLFNVCFYVFFLSFLPLCIHLPTFSFSPFRATHLPFVVADVQRKIIFPFSPGLFITSFVSVLFLLRAFFSFSFLQITQQREQNKYLRVYR